MYASDFRAIARAALRKNWGTAVIVTLVGVLLGGSVGGGTGILGSSGASSGRAAADNSGYSVEAFVQSLPSIFWIIGMAILSVMAVYAIVVFLLGGAATQGLCRYNIDLVTKAQPAGFGSFFSAFHHFGKALLLQLAMGLFITLWTLLFIIPGVLASYSYSMAPYLMAQNPNLGVMEAIRQSKQLMRGRRWRLFGLQFSFIGWAFLCLFTLGIGYLFLSPYVGAAVTAFYLDLTGQLPMGQPMNGYFEGQAGGQQPPQQ